MPCYLLDESLQSYKDSVVSWTCTLKNVAFHGKAMLSLKKKDEQSGSLVTFRFSSSAMLFSVLLAAEQLKMKLSCPRKLITADLFRLVCFTLYDV